MSARQYLPIHESFEGQRTIIYPVKDEVPLRDIFKNKEQLIAYVEEVYRHNSLPNSQYHIAFVWNKHGTPMLDVWINMVNEHSDSGPLLNYLGFENTRLIDKPSDIASGDTIIALSGEEMKRRKFSSTEEYLTDLTLPEFPNGLMPEEEF